MKKIIITGANGNLGSAVTKFFLEKSYTLIATVENEEAKKQMPPHNNLQVEAVNLENETEAALFVQNIINAHGNIDAAHEWRNASRRRYENTVFLKVETLT